MVGRSFTGACPARCAVSPVDSILDKEDYTLEELLDEDELIQECKSLNTRLIIFLKQPSSVRELVRRILVACEGTEVQNWMVGY